MKLFFGVESPQAATTRYRVVIPARPLEARGHIIRVATKVDLGKAQEDFGFDLVMLQRNSTGDTLRFINEMRNRTIPVGYDLDDDLFHIDTWNPVFGLYMSRPDIPWHQTMAIRFCDGVVVSTQPLAEIYSMINPKIRVAPNHVDLKEWESNPFPNFSFGDRTVLVWAGSNTHADSLALMGEALKQALLQRPEAILVLMGLDENPFPFIPKSQLAMFGWSVYPNYQALLAASHIGLAPLYPSTFNASKSDLRVKEYASAKLAIVGSPFGEYGSAIESAGGIVCDNVSEWARAFLDLIDHPADRKSRGQAAYEWVRKWNIWDAGDVFLDAWQSCTNG